MGICSSPPNYLVERYAKYILYVSIFSFLSHDLVMFNCISSFFSTLRTKMKILDKYKISKFDGKQIIINFRVVSICVYW